jgi:guanine deaminase
MLANIQEASKISKTLAEPDTKDPKTKAGPRKYANHLLPIATLLYLATLGGADLCDMKETLGSFARGKSFDALLVSTHTPKSGPSLWVPDDLGAGKHALCELFERFLFCGDDRNISKVWVQGKFVGGRLWKKSESLEDETTTPATGQ